MAVFLVTLALLAPVSAQALTCSELFSRAHLVFNLDYSQPQDAIAGPDSLALMSPESTAWDASPAQLRDFVRTTYTQLLGYQYMPNWRLSKDSPDDLIQLLTSSQPEDYIVEYQLMTFLLHRLKTGQIVHGDGEIRTYYLLNYIYNTLIYISKISKHNFDQETKELYYNYALIIIAEAKTDRSLVNLQLLGRKPDGFRPILEAAVDVGQKNNMELLQAALKQTSLQVPSEITVTSRFNGLKSRYRVPDPDTRN